MHAFSNHKHSVCVSKVHKHVHEKNTDCDLHILRISNAYLPTISYKINAQPVVNLVPTRAYNFLKNHPQLSFSVRGPPTLI